MLFSLNFLCRQSIQFLIIFSLTALCFAPLYAFADLVPCEGAGCKTCHISETVNGVIKWLVNIMAILCAIIIVVAGFQMVTAQGSMEKVSHARSLITNALIGFVILLGAWLIVDTVLKVLLSGNDQSATAPAQLPGFGPWNSIQCSESPAATPIVASGGEGTVSTGPVPTDCTSIQPLSPITDPLAQQMEGGTTVIWENTNPNLRICANKFTSQVGGVVNSAYRPQAYQTHLWEIRERWCTQGLKNNTDPQCAALKSHIGSEVAKHFGTSWNCGAVSQNVSSHGAGTAVDIGGISHGSVPVVAAARNSCLSWANYPGDPWHYNLMPGCTCN